jgi:hypothetical protein
MDTPLPDDNGVLVDTYGHERFSRDVIDAFPSLRQDLVSSAGVLHVQMALLAELVRRSLDSGDMELANRVCVFLDRTLDEPRVSPEIANAIAISFLARINCERQRADAICSSRCPSASVRFYWSKPRAIAKARRGS